MTASPPSLHAPDLECTRSALILRKKITTDELIALSKRYPKTRSIVIAPPPDLSSGWPADYWPLPDGPPENPNVYLAFDQNVSFPEVKKLHVEGHRVSLIVSETNFPKLENLYVNVAMTERNTPHFKLKLPSLKRLEVEHCRPSYLPDFAMSVANCPKLEFIRFYKVIDIEYKILSLPNCKQLVVHRGEGVEKLCIYGPRLEKLTLEACYDLKLVKLLDSAIGPDAVQQFYLAVHKDRTTKRPPPWVSPSTPTPKALPFSPGRRDCCLYSACEVY